MMGVGKSSAGRLVASRLNWACVDSDERVQQRTGNTVQQIFAERGEAAFRAEESEALRDLLALDEPLVVSVAAGAVVSADNRKLLRAAGLVVWLRADVTTLTKRVNGGRGRPLLEADPVGALARLHAERQPLYEELADVTIDVDHLTLTEVADRVTAAADA